MAAGAAASMFLPAGGMRVHLLAKAAPFWHLPIRTYFTLPVTLWLELSHLVTQLQEGLRTS